MMLRLICFVAGLGAIGAMAHKTITHGTGYASPDAYVTLAAAGLVVALAVAVGHVWRGGNYIIGLGMVAALIAGDVFQFGRTVDQEMQRRAALQAPLVATNIKRTEAVQRVSEVRQKLERLGTSSPRLNAAIASHADALEAARTDAAKRGCASNCRKMHKAAIVAAEGEIRNARTAHDAERQAAQQALTAAQAALVAMPVKHSASSAADLLGWSAIVFNALLAGLKASALNIGAIFALAFAGHGGVARRSEPESIEPPRNQVARFALQSYDKTPDGQLLLTDARAAYVRWCRAVGTTVLPLEIFDRELSALIQSANLPIEHGTNGTIIRGMAPRRLLQAA